MLIVDGLNGLNLRASFELADGECVAVQGASGSGKTLLLRALADLDPSNGEVTLNGERREHVSAPIWRRRICFLPAEPGWWADTVAEHFPNWDQAVPLIGMLNLSPACKSWQITRLSTGERQRLALVRAVILQPQVLLLDEPTAALDPDSTRCVESLMGSLLESGTSIVWVTHDREQARRVASRLFVIEGGCLREAEWQTT